ncbi:unannotated protein [freshwater metagenome]|uniref:Unannotated protein n=1 Tax=freshwater metagenome TaxID=449393 RepID=A0A6J6YZP1_9ZZZZ
MSDFASETISAAYQASARYKSSTNARTQCHDDDIVNSLCCTSRPFSNRGTCRIVFNRNVDVQNVAQNWADCKISNINQIGSRPQYALSSHKPRDTDTYRINLAQFTNHRNKGFNNVVSTLRRIATNLLDNFPVVPDNAKTFCSADINSGATSTHYRHISAFTDWILLEPSTL